MAMIEPQELRIGNYVESPSDSYADRPDKVKDFCFKVCLISKGIVKINIGHDAQQRFEEDPVYSYGFEDLKPIRITEEWLERFGFEYSDLNGDSGFWVIKHPNAAGMVKILSGEDGFTYNYQSRLKYVHQLQNLYFALTRQELEVKN